MPNLATHLLIPFFCLLIYYRNKREMDKYIIALLPFAILPDLDILGGLDAHRAVLHNIFFVIIVAIIGLVMSKNRSIVFISVFYVISHIMLDLFSSAYGIAMFYPMISERVYVDINLFLTPSLNILFNFNYGFLPYNPVRGLIDITIVDGVGVISIISASSMYLLGNGYDKRNS